MEQLILVKLGGSILTDKEHPCSLRMDVIKDVSEQIRLYWNNNPPNRLILGNGGGSFGHYYAQKYSLSEGVNGAEALLGMCKGKNGNRYLNCKLVQCLNTCGIPAVSFSVDPVFQDEQITEAMETSETFSESWGSLFTLMEHGMMPVAYGDILFDSVKGCKIVSTEQIFLSLLSDMGIRKYFVEKIIFCTGCDGVLDLDGNLIPVIRQNEFNDWGIFQRKGKEFDVTGGMASKVQMAVNPIINCPVQIINGLKSGNLYQALIGNESIGTMVVN